MQEFRTLMEDKYKFLHQRFTQHFFKHPYTKIEFVVNDLVVSRLSAANYLNKLAEDGVLRKEKIGAANYYINVKLVDLLIGE